MVFRYNRRGIYPASQHERGREAIDAFNDLKFQGSRQESVVDYTKFHTVAPGDDTIPLGIESNSHDQRPQRMIAVHSADITI